MEKFFVIKDPKDNTFLTDVYDLYKSNTWDYWSGDIKNAMTFKTEAEIESLLIENYEMLIGLKPPFQDIDFIEIVALVKLPVLQDGENPAQS